MILVIDNYESFTYNLVQYLGELGTDPHVVRNDQISISRIRQLAPVTGHLYGTGRLVIIYTSASIGGFALSTVGGHQLTLGASAPLFGLFGALIWAGRRTGSSEIGRMALMYAVVFLIFGFLMPNVDNLAHIGGFAGGFLAAYILNPVKQETSGDRLLALMCIAATALSVLVSIVTA